MKTDGTILTALLLLGLVSSSALLGHAVLSLDTWRPPNRVQSASSPDPLKYGVLAVGVMLGAPSEKLSGPAERFRPVQDVHIWLALPDHTLTRLLFLYTNSTGFVAMRLLPDRYLIEVFDPHFDASVLVQVYQGRTTRLTFYVSSFVHSIAFQEVSDQYASGLVPIGSSVFLGIHSNAPVANISDTIFFQKRGGTASTNLSNNGSSGAAKNEIRGTVLSEGLGGGTLWLQIRLSQAMKVSDDSPITMVTYRPSYTITVNSTAEQTSVNVESHSSSGRWPVG